MLLAVLFLGLVNTFFAYLISYWTLQQLGASRFSMVTYVILAVGLALGVFVLGEIFDWRLVLGTVVVFRWLCQTCQQVYAAACDLPGLTMDIRGNPGYA